MDFKSNSSDNEKLYTNLRSNLNTWGYSYPMGLESVDLVNKLLSDFINTTQGFHNLKKICDGQKSEIESEKQSILPLRSENQKIVNENNSLHREMIKIKEDLDRKELKFETTIRKLNEEKEDMKFLITQKDIMTKAAEQETDNIRKKLNEILQKVYGDYNNAGLAGAEKLLKIGTTKPMNIIGKKTEFFLPNALENTNNSNMLNAETAFKSLNNNLSNKEEWARDLREADERSIKFRNETKIVDQRNRELTVKIDGLDKQVYARELEIKRLNDNYYLTDNLDEIKIKYQSNHLQSNIEKLNLQIDFLNKRNHELEESHKLHETKCNGKQIRSLEKEIEKLTTDKKAQISKVKELQNKTSDHEKESKYQINDKDSENKKIIKNNEDLTNELKKTKEDLDKTKTLLEEKKSEFNSEKNLFSEGLNNLKSVNENIKNINNEYLKKYNELKKTHENTINEINLLKGKDVVVNNDIEKSSTSANRIAKEFNEILQENKELRKKLDETDDFNNSLRKENKILTNEKDNLTNNIGLLENRLSSLKDETMIKKSRADNSQLTVQKLETTNKALQNEKISLSSDVDNYSKLIENNKQTIKKLEDKNENYKNQLEASEENLSVIQEEHKYLSNDLTELIKNKKALEDRNKNLEREIEESKSSKVKITELREQLSKVKNERSITDVENQKNLRKLNELNNENLELNETILAKDQQMISIRKEKENLISQLETNSQELTNFNNLLMSNKDVKGDYDEIRSKYNDVNKKLNSAKIETDSLKGDKTLIDIDIKKKDKLNEILRENNEKLSIELNAKREEIKNLKDKITRISEEQLNKLGSIQDHSLISLQIKYDNENKEKEILRNELNIIRKNNNDLKEESSKLYEKNDSYNKILVDADKTREELLNKFRTENTEKKNFESELQIYKENDSKSKNLIAQYNEEIKGLKQGLNSINSNYDFLTNELDAKTEELSRLTLLCRQQQELLDVSSKKFNNINNKSSMDNKRLLEREGELKDIKNSYQMHANEFENTKQILSDKSSEIHNLTHDLQVLAGENNNLTVELSRIAKENEKLLLVRTHLEKNSDLINQRHRANELDMNDLYHNYKEVCKENERLKANLQIFIDENKEAFNYIQNMEKTLNNFQNSINSTQNEKNEFIKKIEILEQYNNQLTDEINRLNDSLRDKDSKTDYLQMNVHVDKEIAKNYETQQMEYQKQISTFKAEKSQLVDTLNNLTKNIEFHKHQTGNLEQKVNNLQTIIQKERLDQQQIAQNANKYKEDAMKLREENKKLVKLYSESKDINNRISNKPRTSLSDTISSEENNVLHGLQMELQKKLVEMENELHVNTTETKTLREENNRLKNILNGFEKDLKMSSDRMSKNFSDNMSDN